MSSGGLQQSRVHHDTPEGSPGVSEAACGSPRRVCLERYGARRVHHQERAEAAFPAAHPTWAKLIDFETTLPTAVEELVRQRGERQIT